MHLRCPIREEHRGTGCCWQCYSTADTHFLCFCLICWIYWILFYTFRLTAWQEKPRLRFPDTNMDSSSYEYVYTHNDLKRGQQKFSLFHKSTFKNPIWPSSVEWLQLSFVYLKNETRPVMCWSVAASTQLIDTLLCPLVAVLCYFHYN